MKNFADVVILSSHLMFLDLSHPHNTIVDHNLSTDFSSHFRVTSSASFKVVPAPRRTHIHEISTEQAHFTSVMKWGALFNSVSPDSCNSILAFVCSSLLNECKFLTVFVQTLIKANAVPFKSDTTGIVATGLRYVL